MPDFPVETVDGQFHDADPATNTPGTVITAGWLNAVQAFIVATGTAVRTILVSGVVSNNDGILFCNTDGGDIVLSLPAIAGLSAGKRFTLKNIGNGQLTVAGADASTIDGLLQLYLLPGDKSVVCFDGTAWQTIL